MSDDLNSLFANTGLDDDAVDALGLTRDNLGQQIMAGMGQVSIDDVNATEALLLMLVVDDSSSILFENNVDAVIQGHNLILDALQDSKAAGEILTSCQLFNRGVLYPFVPLERAVRMDHRNYTPSGFTPLYDMTAVALASVAAKMAEFENGGVAVRSVTYVITDGADQGSRVHTIDSVRPLLKGLLGTESHIIGAMGIDDGYTDFRRIFQGMGVPDQWILTPGNSASEIRAAFGTISQSAIRASQAAGFSQDMLGGGFGN